MCVCCVCVSVCGNYTCKTFGDIWSPYPTFISGLFCERVITITMSVYLLPLKNEPTATFLQSSCGAILGIITLMKYSPLQRRCRHIPALTLGNHHHGTHHAQKPS